MCNDNFIIKYIQWNCIHIDLLLLETFRILFSTVIFHSCEIILIFYPIVIAHLICIVFLFCRQRKIIWVIFFQFKTTAMYQTRQLCILNNKFYIFHILRQFKNSNVIIAWVVNVNLSKPVYSQILRFVQKGYFLKAIWESTLTTISHQSIYLFQIHIYYSYAMIIRIRYYQILYRVISANIC